MYTSGYIYWYMQLLTRYLSTYMYLRVNANGRISKNCLWASGGIRDKAGLINLFICVYVIICACASGMAVFLCFYNIYIDISGWTQTAVSPKIVSGRVVATGMEPDLFIYVYVLIYMIYIYVFLRIIYIYIYMNISLSPGERRLPHPPESSPGEWWPPGWSRIYLFIYVYLYNYLRSYIYIYI